MKITTLLCVLLYQTLLIQSQQEFKLIKEGKIPLNNTFTKVDHLGNIYFSDTKRLIKIDHLNSKQYEYTNLNLGSLTSIDVSDPLRILLFYKDFNCILFLSNNLTEIGSTVKFDVLGHNDVGLACSSSNGGFWIYDNQQSQLFYYDKNNHKIQQSISVNSISEGNISPNYMIERNNNIFLNIPNIGILTFNQFAVFRNSISLINLIDFQVVNNNVVYFSDKYLIEFDPISKLSTTINLPDTISIQKSFIQNNQLYIFKNTSYNIFSFNKK